MSARRIKSTIQTSYIIPLKMRLGNVVSSLCANYNSILLTKKYRSKNLNQNFVRVSARFNSLNFDGIYLLANLLRSGRELSFGSVLFNLNLVEDDGNWTEVFLTSVSGIIDGKKGHAFIPQVDLDPNYLDGSLTFSVEAIVTRQGRNYKNKVFVNHLGVYESIFRLKQELEFLDITKEDE